MSVPSTSTRPEVAGVTPGDDACRRRLTAAGLAHEGEGLSAPDLEGDAVDCGHVAEDLGQIGHLDGDVGFIVTGRLSNTPPRGDRLSRHAVQQVPGVGVLRSGDDLVRRTEFDDAAVSHHGDQVGAVGGDAEVVGDQDDARRRDVRRSSIRSRTCFCTVASSPDVGSSAMIKSGLPATAAAIRTR